MKAILTFLLLLGIAFSSIAQIATNASARFKTRVICKTGLSSTITINPSPEAISTGFEAKDIGTSPGREYQLAWKLTGRRGDKDAYHFTFTRTTKVEGTSKISTTISKEVLFDGHTITIFKDDSYTVTIDSPAEKDVK